MKTSPQIRTSFARILIATFTTLVTVQGLAAPPPALPQASTPQAQGIARLELLTPAQRTSLPDSVIVTLLSGRTATMAQVRQEHNIRMQRFANARALGAESLHRIPVNQVVGNPSNKSPLPMPAVPYAAKDYTDFCTAAQATACLYFPAGVSSYSFYSPGWGAPPLPSMVFDFDPLISDSAVCSAGGGNMLPNNQGCGYAYPVVVTPNFTPGNYTAPATAGCSSNGLFSEIYDPHGAVQIKFTGGIPIVTTNTAQPGLACIVRVIPN